jgi:hypothetical protein
MNGEGLKTKSANDDDYGDANYRRRNNKATLLFVFKSRFVKGAEEKIVLRERAQTLFIAANDLHSLTLSFSRRGFSS